MQYQYPHTIENGNGEVLTFLNRVTKGDEDYLEVENSVAPGVGPPMHVHYFQDECATVVQGRLAAHILGQEPTFHGPGETILFKRGVPHRFWNAGDDLLTCRGWINPAHNIEYFLGEIFRSTKANGGSRPSLFEGAYLQLKYRSEFEIVEIPAFVRSVIFPIIVFAGKLLGKHRRFERAPEPATRSRLVSSLQ